MAQSIKNLALGSKIQDSKGNKFLNGYCFTQNLSSKLLEKGSFECIKDKSDHIPLIFEITK